MTLKLEFFSRKKKKKKKKKPNKQTNKAGKTGSRISCTVFKLDKVFITRVVLYLAQKQYFSLFTVSKSALFAQNPWPGSRGRYPHQRSEYRVTAVQCHIRKLIRAVAAKNEHSKEHDTGTKSHVFGFSPFY